LTGPECFSFRFSGFCSPSYSLEKCGDHLLYKVEDPFPVLEKYFHPNEYEWENFYMDLEKLGIWKWKSVYSHPYIHDGSQWDLVIRWGGRKIKCFGSNSYPPEDGKPCDGTGFTRPFNRFLAMVSALMGNLNFLER
jgi:hypothetical protein